jgi:hypothetical protein
LSKSRDAAASLSSRLILLQLDLGLEWIARWGIEVYEGEMARTRRNQAPSPAQRSWPRQIPPPLRIDDARDTTVLEASFALWSTRPHRPLTKGRRGRLQACGRGFLKNYRYVDSKGMTVVRALTLRSALMSHEHIGYHRLSLLRSPCPSTACPYPAARWPGLHVVRSTV